MPRSPIAYDDPVHRTGMTGDRTARGAAVGRASSLRLLLVLAVIATVSCLVWVAACDSNGDGGGDGDTTTSTDLGGPESGDVEGVVGEEIKVGQAIVTVRALQATFQPATPEQRLSDQTPTAPEAGEGFYQAYVRVENTGATPLRADAEDFVCVVGDSVVGIEPTRSGPLPRSLLRHTSLDFLLTFKAKAGFQPMLLYRPPWYDGIISVSPQSGETTTTSS
jgi:hypothetical protein